MPGAGVLAQDIDVIKKELPTDLLEFFQLTPLPGSEDHQKLHRAGIAMDPDMNNYDTNYVTTAHPRMSRAQWECAYQPAWRRYYTIEHITTVLRRAAATGCNAGNALFLLTWFKGSIEYERIHPLEGGFLRVKSRRNRRPGMAVENVWAFYPKYIAETAVKLVRWAALYLRLRVVYLRIKHDPGKGGYTDLAITPLAQDEAETRDLFQTAAAQAYVGQQRRLQDIRANVPADFV
jgi:hypothetical protein